MLPEPTGLDFPGSRERPFLWGATLIKRKRLRPDSGFPRGSVVGGMEKAEKAGLPGREEWASGLWVEL